MNKLRSAIEALFGSPMYNMNYINYFSYLNEKGQITPRTALEMLMVLSTHVEELEKKCEQYDQNFKDIEEILSKLADKKLEKPIVKTNENAIKVVISELPKENTVVKCPECGDEYADVSYLEKHRQRKHMQK